MAIKVRDEKGKVNLGRNNIDLMTKGFDLVEIWWRLGLVAREKIDSHLV